MHELVSIVIPCYNHENYVDSCIQSIINQSYDNIELLICDDCSKDSSYEKLLTWKPFLEKRFPRVVIYRNEVNQGVCKTLNGLVHRANGAFIKTLASDDMLRQNAISDYVNFADGCDFDIAYSNAYYISESEQYPVEDRADRKTAYKAKPPCGKGLTGKLIERNFVQGASLFIRKETFEKYGAFDESYFYEDWEYLLRISLSGTLEYMDEIPVYYRRVDGSLSHYDTDSEAGRKKFRRYYGDARKIFEKYKAGASDEQRSSFFNRAIRTAIVLKDAVLLDEMIEDVQAHKLHIYLGNCVRIMAFKTGIYSFLRSVKNRLKGK